MISMAAVHPNYRGFPFAQTVLYRLLGEDSAKMVVEDRIDAPIALFSQKAA